MAWCRAKERARNSSPWRRWRGQSCWYFLSWSRWHILSLTGNPDNGRMASCVVVSALRWVSVLPGNGVVDWFTSTWWELEFLIKPGGGVGVVPRVKGYSQSAMPERLRELAVDCIFDIRCLCRLTACCGCVLVQKKCLMVPFWGVAPYGAYIPTTRSWRRSDLSWVLKILCHSQRAISNTARWDPIGKTNPSCLSSSTTSCLASTALLEMSSCDALLSRSVKAFALNENVSGANGLTVGQHSCRTEEFSMWRYSARSNPSIPALWIFTCAESRYVSHWSAGAARWAQSFPPVYVAAAVFLFLHCTQDLAARLHPFVLGVLCAQS